MFPVVFAAFILVPLFEPAGEIHPSPVVCDGHVDHLLVGEGRLIPAVGAPQGGFQFRDTDGEAIFEVVPPSFEEIIRVCPEELDIVLED